MKKPPLLVAPSSTPLQRRVSTQSSSSSPPVPSICIVTGGTGFVGTRLVEMLIERGASKVISFDVVPPPSNAWDHPNIEWRVGDITDAQAVDALLSTPNIGCVWHNAAAVGPFHPLSLYHKVNYLGTLNILAACRKYNIPKLVFSSSPSTRFTGVDVDGLTEDQMPPLPLQQYMQPYAQTKAMAEMEVTASCCESLLTVSIAPHQVYGPRDNLFLPNLLEAAKSNKLRIFGNGLNRICFTHVDNYCHGLILAEYALVNINSPACGKFYIVTDGTTHPNGEQYLIFWQILNEAIVSMGYTSLYTMRKLPKTLLLVVAIICEILGKLVGVTMKLNRFNVIVLTMHRWFDIAASHRDLNYTPIVDFREGWDETLVWFKANWLSKQQIHSGGILGIATSTQDKIDIQDRSAKKIK